ncbi:MAG: 4Fe-4S binding protein [Bacteroidales bacterium]|jgi:epoxyqueuosine reductase QueG|nr:4Fe-4S binding protein [Bacteroidales bacterium]
MGQLDKNIIREIGIASGASVVGITPSDRFTNATVGFSPEDKLPGCKTVIVFGSPFPREALSKTTIEYTSIRNEMVEKMNHTAKEAAKQVKEMGYKTKIIGGLGGKWDNGRFRGHISLKHAAELAGLGCITRNYLLTNPDYGNLLWFSAILTNARIEADQILEYDICKGCNLCVDVCPSGALNDPALFGQKNCYKVCYKTIKGKLELKCFECRRICPHRFGINQKHLT